jgi:hypothetical protein
LPEVLFVLGEKQEKRELGNQQLGSVDFQKQIVFSSAFENNNSLTTPVISANLCRL